MSDFFTGVDQSFFGKALTDAKARNTLLGTNVELGGHFTGLPGRALSTFAFERRTTLAYSAGALHHEVWIS